VSKTIIKTIIYMAFDIEMIKKVYDNMTSRVDAAREIVGHPLTLTEKILYNHLWDGKPSKAFARELIMLIFSDRVACQDATAQMALLQFMHAGKLR
jgi:aconitate hydratase